MQSPGVHITTLIFTTVMFCNQIINNTKNLIHLTELFRHGLMLLWFTDLMNATEEVTILRLHSLNL